MAKGHRANCRACGKNKTEVGEISWAGYCEPCGKTIYEANNAHLHEKQGEFYLHWTRRSELAMRKRRIAAEQGQV
jgi:hypothetical protein